MVENYSNVFGTPQHTEYCAQCEHILAPQYLVREQRRELERGFYTPMQGYNHAYKKNA